MKPCSRMTARFIRNADRSNGFVTDASDWVLSGPHFFLANPFNKTPRASAPPTAITTRRP